LGAGLTAYNSENIEIGSGHYSITPHFYSTDTLHYSKLSAKEKRIYDESRYCKLQRADYKSIIDYQDQTSSKVNVQLYYDRDILFYVKYEEDSTNGTIDTIIFHHFFYADINSELAKNPDLKHWIADLNQEIIRKCLDN